MPGMVSALGKAPASAPLPTAAAADVFSSSPGDGGRFCAVPAVAPPAGAVKPAPPAAVAAAPLPSAAMDKPAADLFGGADSGEAAASASSDVFPAGSTGSSGRRKPPAGAVAMPGMLAAASAKPAAVAGAADLFGTSPAAAGSGSLFGAPASSKPVAVTVAAPQSSLFGSTPSDSLFGEGSKKPAEPGKSALADSLFSDLPKPPEAPKPVSSKPSAVPFSDSGLFGTTPADSLLAGGPAPLGHAPDSVASASFGVFGTTPSDSLFSARPPAAKTAPSPALDLFGAPSLAAAAGTPPPPGPPLAAPVSLFDVS
jgi:hypothetical protein